MNKQSACVEASPFQQLIPCIIRDVIATLTLLSGLKQRAALRKQRASAASTTDPASRTSASDNSTTTTTTGPSYETRSSTVQDWEASSAEARVGQEQQQESSHHEGDQALFLLAWEGPSDSGDPAPYQNQHQQQTRQQRFSANRSSHKEQLSGQLGGMRRRALLKKQQQVKQDVNV